MRYILPILFLLLINISCKKRDSISTPSVLQLKVVGNGVLPMDNDANDEPSPIGNNANNGASPISNIHDIDIFVFKEPSGVIDMYKHETNIPLNKTFNVNCTTGKKTVIIVANSKIDFEKNRILDKQELLKKTFSLSDNGKNIQSPSRSMFGSIGATIVGSGSKLNVEVKRHAASVIVNWDADAKGNVTDANGWTTIGADNGSKGDMYKIEKAILINSPSQCNMQPNKQLPIMNYLCGKDITLSPLLKQHKQVETDALSETFSHAYTHQPNRAGIYTYVNHPSETGGLPTKVVLIARYKTAGASSTDQGTLCYYPIAINYGKNGEGYRMGASGLHIKTGSDIGNGVSSNTEYNIMATITGRGAPNPWMNPLNIKVDVRISGWKPLSLNTNIGKGNGVDTKNQKIAFVPYGLTSIHRVIGMTSSTLLKYDVNTDQAQRKHTLSIPSGFTGTVYWGDGSSTQQTSPKQELTHTYLNLGKHSVVVSGSWTDKNVKLDLSKNNIDREPVTLVSLGGGATGFSAEGSDVIVDINQLFFKEVSSTITNLHAAFSKCQFLKDIQPMLLSGCTKVTDLSYMFNECSGLSMSLNTFYMFIQSCTKVTDLSYMFNECYNLTGHIPNGFLDYCSYVTNMSHMFTNTGIGGKIPDKLFFHCVKVTDLSYMFRACMSLTGSIPNDFFVNCLRLKDISDMFYNDLGLTGSVRLPYSVSNKKEWNEFGSLKEL